MQVYSQFFPYKSSFQFFLPCVLKTGPSFSSLHSSLQWQWLLILSTLPHSHSFYFLICCGTSETSHFRFYSFYNKKLFGLWFSILYALQIHICFYTVEMIFLKSVCSVSLLAYLLQNPCRMLCIMQSFCSLVLRLLLLFSCIGYSHDSHLFYIFVSIKFHFSVRFFRYHFLHFYFSLVLYATYLLFYALMIHIYRSS